jgi:hypothetical protein
VIVNVAPLPDGLFAEIFAGLSAHVVVEADVGIAQLRYTSAGKVEPAGVVVKVRGMFAWVPAVNCTVPGTDCARAKSRLVRENVVEAPVPAMDAVTL